MQDGTATLEGGLAVSYKVDRLSPPDVAIVLLGTYLKELKIYVYIRTYTRMSTGVLFIITKT